MLPLQICSADLGKPIVWLEEGISLSGIKQVIFPPVSNNTGETFEVDVLNMISESILEELTEAGFEVLKPDHSAIESQALVLKTSLVSYVPGNVSGRWVGTGSGASICILRSFLMSKETDDVFGEIVSAKMVDSGGLFSAGAEKTVPVDAAKKTTRQLIKLLETE